MSQNTALKVAESYGYMTAQEVEALKFLVNLVKIPEPLFVNVGAGSGTSALAIREANLSARIVTVDMRDDSPYGGITNERNAFEGTGYKLPDQILGDSRDVASKWQFGPIDLIFIDDGHLEPEIRGDILGWMPHVKHNGIMVFHDYGSEFWPAVRKVVDELLVKPHYIMVLSDTLAAYRIRSHD